MASIPNPVNRAWEMIIDGRRVVAIDTNRYSAREMTSRARQSWRNRMSRIRPLHRASK